jgi:hypothetical protein
MPTSLQEIAEKARSDKKYRFQNLYTAIPWPDVKKKVERLQMRIAKATREGKHLGEFGRATA